MADMKKIINVITQEEVKFTQADIPMLIHGKEHAGASLLTITLAAEFHDAGDKLLIFTAYDMAKEEFLKQVESTEGIFNLEDEVSIEEALKFQTIMVKSGDTSLFLKVVSKVDDRIILIKNIETIQVPIFNFISQYPFIVSGDVGVNPIQQDFNNFAYSTKILFSPLAGEIIPQLEKYQAVMRNSSGECIVAVDII